MTTLFLILPSTKILSYLNSLPTPISSEILLSSWFTIFALFHTFGQFINCTKRGVTLFFAAILFAFMSFLYVILCKYFYKLSAHWQFAEFSSLVLLQHLVAYNIRRTPTKKQYVGERRVEGEGMTVRENGG